MGPGMPQWSHRVAVTGACWRREPHDLDSLRLHEREHPRLLQP